MVLNAATHPPGRVSGTGPGFGGHLGGELGHVRIIAQPPKASRARPSDDCPAVHSPSA
jgi:hypothetical protein